MSCVWFKFDLPQALCESLETGVMKWPSPPCYGNIMQRIEEFMQGLLWLFVIIVWINSILLWNDNEQRNILKMGLVHLKYVCS